MAEITLNQDFFFDSKKPIPLQDIARSLIALEEMTTEFSPILEKVFPGLQISAVEIKLEKLEIGSLKEHVIVKLFFGNQEKFDEFLDKTRGKLGIEALMNKPFLFYTLIVAGGLLTVASYHAMTGNSSAKQTIEANNNTIIQIGAAELNMSAADLEAVIRSALPPVKKGAKLTVDLLKPATSDPGSTLKINETALIKGETIKALPSNFEDTEEEFIEDFEKEPIIVRATDLDTLKKGWGGVIEKFSTKRAKMQFDPSIRIADLEGISEFTASGSIIFKRKGKDEKIVTTIFIRDIHNQAN